MYRRISVVVACLLASGATAQQPASAPPAVTVVRAARLVDPASGSVIVSLDAMKAIVDEAHRVGRRVAAHAIGDTATRIAAEAGVSSIEHAYTVPDAVLRIMADKGIYLVATDYPAEFYLNLSSPVNAEQRARQLAGAQQFAKSNGERLLRAMRMGVRIAFGSDEYYDVPGHTRGQASLLTLQSYQEAGMKPIDVLRAATINAADLCWDGATASAASPKGSSRTSSESMAIRSRTSRRSSEHVS